MSLAAVQCRSSKNMISHYGSIESLHQGMSARRRGPWQFGCPQRPQNRRDSLTRCVVGSPKAKGRVSVAGRKDLLVCLHRHDRRALTPGFFDATKEKENPIFEELFLTCVMFACASQHCVGFDRMFRSSSVTARTSCLRSLVRGISSVRISTGNNCYCHTTYLQLVLPLVCGLEPELLLGLVN